MNKKKLYKKVFSKQIASGFQFKYLNYDRTMEEYCLEKDSICICFNEDYMQQWLWMQVKWDKKVTLISCDGIVCCTKIHCKNKKKMEEELKKIYIFLSEKEPGMLSENQYCEMVNIYYDFLESNNFFENIVYESVEGAW